MVVLASLPLLAACSGGGRDDQADDLAAATTTTAAPTPASFCEQLVALRDDDPFARLFGHADPMQAAVAFDRAQAEIDALLASAPESMRAAATRYRDTLEGYRALILPSTTVDEAVYRARFDELRAEQEAARAELDAYAAERCG